MPSHHDNDADGTIASNMLDAQADERFDRARFLGALYGKPESEVRHLLTVETLEELSYLKALALECQWFELAVTIKDELKRRAGEVPV